MTPPSICVICGLPFESRTSYGLCPLCINVTTLREWDRLTSAKRFAERAKLPCTLTLVEWMSVISDHRGLCAYCMVYSHSIIDMVLPLAGLTKENAVPCCRACLAHRKYGFETAMQRVQAYLQGEYKPEQATLAVTEEEYA